MSGDSAGAAGEEIRDRADLARWFHEAGTADRGSLGRIGVEAEFLPIDPRTCEAAPYAGAAGVEGVLERLLARGFHGAPSAAGRLSRLTRGDLAVNLEPGAQVEVSGSPFTSLGEVAAELALVGAELGAAAREAGFRLCGHGVQPVSDAREIAIVPKNRYAIMERHFAARGGARYRDMMRRTASVQASFDFADERDAGRKLRLALLLAPVASAIFANSPLALGRPSGLATERVLIWTETDGARSGSIPAVFDGAFSFERYVDFALGVPTILLRAPDGGVEEAGGAPFGALLARGGPGGRRLTRADWNLHLTTIFTDARLKGFIEVRSCDAPRPADAMAVPALFTGLLYHPPALEAALDLLLPLRAELEAARLDVARLGLEARVARGASMLDLARELVRLAGAGLDARGRGERRFLAPAEQIVTTGRTSADRALEVYGRGGVPAVVEAAAL